MKLSDFDYHLPKELIATNHMKPRDHSRLLVLDRSLGFTRDKKFYEIIEFLKKGDVLVFNNSKVFKARIYGVKKTGGKIEFLLIRPVDDFSWETLVKGKIAEGDKIFFENNLVAELINKEKDGTYQVKFNRSSVDVFNYLEKEGEIPLPPYIRIKNHESIIKKGFYQTTYADKIGSVAAPTAGFHFTPELIKKIKDKGIECLNVTLHVGPGTFLPVKTEKISEHQMHEEFFEVEKEVWKKILKAKKEGRRVIAVGTTTTRVLEAMAEKFSKNPKDLNNPKNLNPIFGSTKIFIYPPYKFQIVDALITNFHLPKSTLLMLVSAFAGTDLIKKTYKKAVQDEYRFFSFGDAMMIV